MPRDYSITGAIGSAITIIAYLLVIHWKIFHPSPLEMVCAILGFTALLRWLVGYWLARKG